MSDIKLGKLIDGPAFRDAIHIAVVAVTSDEELEPGTHVGLVEGSVNKVQHLNALYGTEIGIVDPFLKSAIKPGQRFWLVLYPQTITSLRHEWTHPAFHAVEKANAEKWLADFAERNDLTVEELIQGARNWVEKGHFGYLTNGIDEVPGAFWEHFEQVTGVPVPQDQRADHFSCSC